MRDLHRNKPQPRLPACSGKRDFPVAPARPLPWAGFFPALFYCFRVNPQPGIKPQAPGHRLPVPAGWRFGEAGPTFEKAQHGCTIKWHGSPLQSPPHGQALALLTPSTRAE